MRWRLPLTPDPNRLPWLTKNPHTPDTDSPDLPSSPLHEPFAMLRLIGVTFTLTLAVNVYLAPVSHIGLSPGETLPWLLCMLAFLGCFLAGTAQPDTPGGRRRGLGLAALQSLCCFGANILLDGNSLTGGLLLLIAAQVAVRTSWKAACLWALLQSVGLVALFRTFWNSSDAVSYPVGFFYFQLFAASSMLIAVRESRSRASLHEVVDELRSTRTLLREATRKAERLSISREVHDVLGHHLTAIGMNLQLAQHTPQPTETQRYVQQAQAVTQTLMQEVRQTVHGLRETASTHLGTELQELLRRVPLQVQLTLPENLRDCCPVVTHVLLRSVQEILTNAARHGQASQVWLDFQQVGPVLHLHARDDGRGAAKLRFGCGLKGMQERLESIGGQLEIRATPGHGVNLLLRVPLRENP